MTTETLPKTMKALLQPNPASPHLVLTDLPVPVPKPGSTEHLVRVHAAALTNGELLWRHNFPLPPSPDNPSIFIPLFDVAGTILTSPPHSPFPPGTEIYTRTSYTRTGSGSQYTLVTTAELAVRPQILSWAESATVPMSAMTAWQALFVHAGLTPTQGAAGNRDADGDRDRGKKVFVMGASGGVGIWVVQLARWAGLEVGGTARADNREFVRGLGAGEVVDYRDTDIRAWAGAEGKADIVVDCVGGKSLADAWFVVKDGGVLVSVVQPPGGVRPREVEGKRVRDLFFVMESRGEQLVEVTRGLDEGRFVARLDSVFEMERFEEAFEKLEGGGTRGKIVLDMGVEK